MFPDKDVPGDQRILKGFNWRYTSRPRHKDDIFRKTDTQPEVPEIKTE
jgi:hypothetical protein